MRWDRWRRTATKGSRRASISIGAVTACHYRNEIVPQALNGVDVIADTDSAQSWALLHATASERQAGRKAALRW
ncbi:hypothetical protein KIF59_11555 [Enterobacter cloacae subsp. cloacae]|nr:hypothetical protein [Enterobacter cloacae subsp. cloacae]